MNQLRRLPALALLAAATSAAPAVAQNTNSDAATMQALLTEVRLLRRTLEKSIMLGPKMQLLLQRAQMQDQKVARISQQLEDVRKQIATEAAQQTKVGESIAQIEQEISSEADTERRKQMEDMRAGLKKMAANGPDQQLQTRESALTNTLQTEQAVLNEINEKLDALERQFDVSPQ